VSVGGIVLLGGGRTIWNILFVGNQVLIFWVRRPIFRRGFYLLFIGYLPFVYI